MSRFLITNDDGISSDGIVRLARAARDFGEVVVIAPKKQRSAASHCITLHDPVDVWPCDFPVDGVMAFSCSGMPADCVRIGCLHLLQDKPDVVLSGINYGYNVASDVQYSATVGAAFEGACQGCLSIALSEKACDRHEVTDAYLPVILEKLLKKTLPSHSIFNVNFPGCSLADYRGIQEDLPISTGMIYRDHFRVLDSLPGGGLRLMTQGIYNEEAEPGTDFRAVIDNYISIGIVRNVG